MYIVTIRGIVKGVYPTDNAWKEYSNVVKIITLYQSVTLKTPELVQGKICTVHESSHLCPNILSHVEGRERERQKERKNERKIY